MATEFADLFIALARPFDPTEVKTYSKGGKTFHYITGRVVQNRLDSVCGPEHWKDEFFETRDGLKCRISLRLDGEWIGKEDGGAAAGMSEHDDDEKSAYSSAFKRAAVKWGVGRYLYRDGVPDYDYSPRPSSEPAGLEPVGTSEALHSAEPGANGKADEQASDPPPKSGRHLFAKLKDLEQHHSVSLIKGVSSEGRKAGFPDRMTEWTPEQVAEAWPHVLAAIARAGVKPVPEAQLRAYHAMLWKKACFLVNATIEDGRIASQAECLRCVNRLLDALSPGEHIERLGELRDVDRLVRLIELADEELRASAPKGGAA